MLSRFQRIVTIVRDDRADLIYSSMDGKFDAVVEDIAERNKNGQPVLVGTVAIETSELISKFLTKKGIKHNVLNAKNHEREAEIIANAGHQGLLRLQQTWLVVVPILNLAKVL